MKASTIYLAMGVAAVISGSAMAQDNPPSSATGLNAGDNAQTTTSHKTGHAKKMKSPKSGSTGQSMKSGGTATPSGPRAPVSASGSGS